MSAKHAETFKSSQLRFHPRQSISGSRWWNAGKLTQRPRIRTTNRREVSSPFQTFWVSSHFIVATTLQDVRLELTRTETLQLASGRPPRHKVTMMGFFSMGFDIEDYQ